VLIQRHAESALSRDCRKDAFEILKGELNLPVRSSFRPPYREVDAPDQNLAGFPSIKRVAFFGVAIGRLTHNNTSLFVIFPRKDLYYFALSRFCVAF